MGMLKKLFKLLCWLAGLGLVALVAVLVYISAIDPNEHKGWIEARFYKETGRELSLNGAIAYTFYPWLGVEATDVAIADTEAFGAGPFASLDYLKLRVKTLPLLREAYEVDTVVVQGAVLNLVRNEQGVANWDRFDGAAEKDDEPLLSLAALALGGVAIEDARVTLDNRQASVRYEFSDIDASIEELVYGDPVAMSLSFHGRSDKPALDATVALTGTINYTTDGRQFALAPLNADATLRSKQIPGGATPAALSALVNVDLIEGTAALSGFTLDMLDATVTGDISLQEIDAPAPVIAATLDANGQDLSLLFKTLEVEPLASQLARMEQRSFRISASVDADLERGDIDLSELSANLPGADISGAVKARDIHSDAPGYQGELNATGSDLPTLLQVFGQLQGGQDTALATYGRKLGGVPTKSFHLNTVFDADLKSGDMSVPVLSLQALGITATGALQASDMGARKGKLEGNLNIKGNRLAGLLNALGQPGLAETLQSVEIDTLAQGKRSVITLEPLTVQALFAGPDIPGAGASMTLNANTRINLDKETLVLDELSLLGLGLESSGQVEFTDIFDTPTAAGRLQVAPFNLRQLTQQLKLELPATADENVFSRVSWSGGFDLSDAGLSLEDMALQLDDTRLDGEFSITESATRPVTQFDLAVDQIDLDRYLPPDSETSARPAAAKNEDAARAALPVAALTATDVDADLEVGRLILAGARLDDLRIRLETRDGVLQADPITASLYEGRLSADVRLDAGAEPPVLTLNSNLQNIQAEPLLADMTGTARLRGKGNFSAALAAEGNSVEAMKRNLNGQMSMSFIEGAVAGFDLGRALRQWKQFKKGQVIDDEARAATEFTEFSGNPVATNGIIRMDDLALKAPGFRLQGSGVLADLHNSSIDYQAIATVDNTAKSEGDKDLAELEDLELPLIIEGALDDPKIRLAWEDILKSSLVERVLDVLERKLPGASDPEESENGQEPEKGAETEPLKDLLKEGLKEGLKGIFK